MFYWALTIAKGEMVYSNFDEEFTYGEWMRAVDAADEIVQFGTYEELRAFLLSFNKTTHGKIDFELFLSRDTDFWEHIDSYRKDAYDFRKWSELAIKPGDIILVWGA